jgi:hypothetical protein
MTDDAGTREAQSRRRWRSLQASEKSRLFAMAGDALKEVGGHDVRRAARLLEERLRNENLSSCAIMYAAGQAKAAANAPARIKAAAEISWSIQRSMATKDRKLRAKLGGRS